MAELASDFHFLRPWWFAGLVPAIVVLLLYHWQRRSAGNWQKIINPLLLPYLMLGENKKQKHNLFWMLFAWSLVCVGLAGPTWQQLPQPVHKQDSALVVMLDLSPSMLAQDIKPSRLVRARYKLIDILNNRKEGVTGLVVYGGTAHVVSPLTDDSNTIASLVPVLAPTLMPEYGSNVEDAVEQSLQLLANAGYNKGDLLLITDEVKRAAFGAISTSLRKAGDFRLLILGVGSKEGAPIPLGAGGFVKDANGGILLPGLNEDELQTLAKSNGGMYRRMASDDSDVEALLSVTDKLFPDATRELDRSFDLWDDQGFWLAILVLPFLIASFRRGSVAVLMLIPLLYNQPAEAFGWRDLWQTPDQQAAHALKEGDAETAATLFEDSQWRGSAAYKAGDYHSAIDSFLENESADANYNRGNALAKAGELEGAIEAYDKALKLEPGLDDAKFNRDLVEKLKNQQQQQKQQKQNQQDNDQQHNNQQSGDNMSQQQNQKNQQNQAGENQQPAEQNSSSANRNQDQNASRGEQNYDESGQQKPQPDTDGQQEKPNSEEQQQNARQQQEPENQQQNEQQRAAETTPSDEKDDAAKQELEQWLRRVPDDPGGLLREKFRYQQQQMRGLQQRTPRPPTRQHAERW